MKKYIIFCALFLSLNIFADDFKDGTLAYEKKDYLTAYNKWIGLAVSGNPFAQINIAVLYQKGLGVYQSNSEAYRWMLMAAQRGEINAQINVGVMFQLGNGVIKDLNRADMWLTIASISKYPGNGLAYMSNNSKDLNSPDVMIYRDANNASNRALEMKTALETQMSDDDKRIVKNLVTTCMNQMLQNCN